MSAISTEEQQAMCDSFARLLAERSDESQVRAAMETSLGYDPALWAAMAEMGLLGVIIAPEYGGIGGGAVLLEGLLEEAGKHLLCSPFISTAVIAAKLISSSNSDDIKQELLSAICAGDQVIAVAATGDKGQWTRDDIDLQAEKKGDGWVLDGSASYVLHAEGAHQFLMLAQTADGVSVFAAESGSSGLAIESMQANDPTLRLSQVRCSAVKARLLPGVDETAIDGALNLARIAQAAEHAGGVKRIFDITIEYLQTRHQFGRQIGSYQSLKHMAADMLVEVESATSAARHAARAWDAGADDAQTLISLAAFAGADAYRDVTAQAIQMHGGIAYTWEHPAHLFWRRARTGLWLFGSSDQHRETYLASLENA